MRISHKKQSGFSLMETIIGVTIFTLGLSLLFEILSGIAHGQRLAMAADKISVIPLAVQSRAAHDGLYYSLWDENGGLPATGDTRSWDSNNINNFMTNYLVGRKNPDCGNLAEGWNPINNGGGIDLGEETRMEITALVGCSALRNKTPFNIEMSAAVSPDAATGMIGVFALYFNMENVSFGEGDLPDNNIENYILLRNEFEEDLQNKMNGTTKVHFGLSNDLNDTTDDTIYTTSECEDELLNGNKCDMFIYVNFSGSTNGMAKRRDNQDFFVDDVTFGESLGSGRQICGYWERNGNTDTWTGDYVDCAIKAGSGDDDVQVVVNRTNSSEFIITEEINNQTGDENDGSAFRAAGLTKLCHNYTASTVGGARELVKTENQTPCGILRDGSIIQLITEGAMVEQAVVEDIIADDIYAGHISLYNATNGSIFLEAYNTSGLGVVFSVDNNGNTTIAGELTVDGKSTFNGDVEVEGQNLIVNRSARFALNDAVNDELVIGGAANESLIFSRNGTGTITMESTSVNFNLLRDNDQGIFMERDSGQEKITMTADGGIFAGEDTDFHARKSTLTGRDFLPSDTEARLELSKLVSKDYVQMLDSKYSDIQIVGVDRVEGAAMILNKPDCLYFMNDDNYGGDENANPFRDHSLHNTSTGTSYARLILVPMYFKTYNSAFGDNQIFAQHASHSGADSWDIFLYLSGEGAFGTGAREDGAGGSIAITMCDYNSINFYE